MNGYLMYIHHAEGTGPWGRELYTECVATFAALLSLVWFVPFTWTFMHYPLDVFVSIMWFASFGALTNWIHRIDCQRAFNWNGYQGWACDLYKTNEAFVFMSAGLWLISSFLSCWVFHTRHNDGSRYVHALSLHGYLLIESFRSRIGRTKEIRNDSDV